MLLSQNRNLIIIIIIAFHWMYLHWTWASIDMLNNSSFIFAESVLACPQKEKKNTKETKKESINAS